MIKGRGILMRHRNTLIGIVLIAMCGILFAGCTLDAKSVKLHTKEEMQKIVDERYGDAEFVSMEEDKDKNRKTFTYRDKKYGFTYEVESHPHSVGMDGSTFFYDGAGIYYRYEEPFLEYFTRQEEELFAKQGIELCEELKFKKTSRGDRMFCLKEKMLVSTDANWEEDMKFAWERVHAYKEVPETTRDYQIKVYNSDQTEFFGTLSAEGFSTAEEQRITYYMDQARGLGQIQGEITYLRTEKKKVSEVPGLSQQNFYEDRIRENDLKVTVYYFSYEGKEYFIVDTWVAQISDNGGGIFQYYQNYKEYPVSGE